MKYYSGNLVMDGFDSIDFVGAKLEAFRKENLIDKDYFLKSLDMKETTYDYATNGKGQPNSYNLARLIKGYDLSETFIMTKDVVSKNENMDIYIKKLNQHLDIFTLGSWFEEMEEFVSDKGFTRVRQLGFLTEFLLLLESHNSLEDFLDEVIVRRKHPYVSD